jgi:hypothetical protein
MSEQYKLKQSYVEPFSCLALFDLNDTLLTSAIHVVWGKFLVVQGILLGAFARRNSAICCLHQAELVVPHDFFGLLRPHWKAIGFDQMVATELGSGSVGAFAGRAAHMLATDQDCVAHHCDWLPQRSTHPLVVVSRSSIYSDSIGDLLLALALGQQVVVDPSTRLEQEAHRCS